MSGQTEFQVNNGKLSLFVKSGEVIAKDQWSETEVTSSGGGGYVGPQGGHVKAPTVSSSSKTKQEIWFREKNGLESSIQLTDSDFSVCTGQKIWLAYGANNKNPDTSHYLLAYNHSSDRYGNLLHSWISWLYQARLVKKPFVYRLLTFWLAFVSSAIAIWGISPLYSQIKARYSLVDGFIYVVENLTFPKSYQQWLHVMGEISVGEYILLSIFTLLLLALLYWPLNFIGKLLFLNRWERKQVDKIYHKVLNESKKLTDY